MTPTKAQREASRKAWTAGRIHQASEYLQSALGCLDEALAEVRRGGICDDDARQLIEHIVARCETTSNLSGTPTDTLLTEIAHGISPVE